MISLLRKPPPEVSAWHPDFRDPTSLPDVKVVRTSFFVNGVSVFIMLLVAMLLTVQEFGRHAVRTEIRTLEERIQEHGARNEQVLKQDSAFKQEERTINDALAYIDGSLDLSTLLIALAETLHPDMTFTTIRYQSAGGPGSVSGKQILISGSIWAEPDAAASVVTEYLNAFHENPYLAERVEQAVPTSLVPTPEGDKMAFGIQLNLKRGKAAAAKEEKKT